MPRYFFHLVKGTKHIHDDVGEELQPEDVSPVSMLRALERLRSRSNRSVEDWCGWSITIADEAGRIVQIIVI